MKFFHIINRLGGSSSTEQAGQISYTYDMTEDPTTGTTMPSMNYPSSTEATGETLFKKLQRIGDPTTTSRIKSSQLIVINRNHIIIMNLMSK